MKANPKAWFPHPFIASIGYRKVDKWAVNMAKYKPYFPTWGEAHAHMVEKSADRLKKAKAELKAATAFDAKVHAMTVPQPQEQS